MRIWQLWLAAYLIPILWQILLQFVMFYWQALSDFMRQQAEQPLMVMYVLTVIFIIPAYLVLLYQTTSWKQRLVRWGIFSFTLVIYVPLLWVLGFNISRWLFV